MLSLLERKSQLEIFCFYPLSPSICLSVYLSIFPSVHLPIYPSINLSICPSVHLFICSSVHLFICSSVHLSICPSVHLSIWPYKLNTSMRNRAGVRDPHGNLGPSWTTLCTFVHLVSCLCSSARLGGMESTKPTSSDLCREFIFLK
jgi:hypothetical protein